MPTVKITIANTDGSHETRIMHCYWTELAWNSISSSVLHNAVGMGYSRSSCSVNAGGRPRPCRPGSKRHSAPPTAHSLARPCGKGRPGLLRALWPVARAQSAGSPRPTPPRAASGLRKARPRRRGTWAPQASGEPANPPACSLGSRGSPQLPVVLLFLE